MEMDKLNKEDNNHNTKGAEKVYHKQIQDFNQFQEIKRVNNNKKTKKKINNKNRNQKMMIMIMIIITTNPLNMKIKLILNKVVKNSIKIRNDYFIYNYYLI